MNNIIQYASGEPLPHGVLHHGIRHVDTGINLSLFSRHATSINLLLFSSIDDTLPAKIIPLDPEQHRIGDIWHIHLEHVAPGTAYAFQVDGPYAPEQGHRFKPSSILLDPYARAVSRQLVSRNQSCTPVFKGIFVDEPFDWGGDRFPSIPVAELVLYEVHVRGFTQHSSSGVRQPGTFSGVIEKIPYLQELGVNAVEFLPIQAYNPDELINSNPLTGERLRNYWGYSTVSFFALHPSYGSGAYPGCEINEFKSMVKALHAAGIEVILDVVFNHTAEGGDNGPTLSFKGLDNIIYYQLEDDRQFYRNYSGCGNTFNCNHPVVRNFILDCLRYWVIEMHVDGFRFDLAPILGRDGHGHLLSNPPLLEKIAEDPILSRIKLIAEAWDAGGAYQVGSFPGKRWSDWNGAFRDDIRCYWRGDYGKAGAFASRLCGSADLYNHSDKTPDNSINFITCHDGFTLEDLVSYDHKHNLANGEDNRDGTNDNYSSNHGEEGPTDDAAIKALRLRQKKNLLATLFLSRGVPMLLGGDELGRTQQGNNNAYCQDNEISWFDWHSLSQHHSFFEFVKGLIRFRKQHPQLSLSRFYHPDEISWFNASGNMPDWQVESALGCHIHTFGHEHEPLCLLFNPGSFEVSFPLPERADGCQWVKAIDTGNPHNSFEPQRLALRHAEGQEALFLPVMSHSLVVLCTQTVKTTPVSRAKTQSLFSRARLALPRHGQK